ncbi:DUF2431 domain-containing protein [Aestuariibacter sp. AA17]|uniref:DUF2431 domain-containing protein n=1 Tax=Fluctibacter corallii TaxID=2984329 RepID=A0ABT3AAC6_9ALTE|nr:class I SAM-dependent methyltransferase [Aestuariibacter sp. AA17]MCV2885583.1 DUF2431 domain-containing protein [Aestuariibacter sp. AA17]
MYFQPSWRVLTVGDGDLSFSYSLKQRCPSLQLQASVLDSESALSAKYQTHFAQSLQRTGVPVHFGIDITDPASWKGKIVDVFDVVIFQFPLIPQLLKIKGMEEYDRAVQHNLQHRRLLRYFLVHSALHLLCEKGARLSYISSKDVKPYSHWDIENAITLNTGIRYLGKTPFDASDYSEYQVRNVNRDNYVADTRGYTYVYSDKTHHENAFSLIKPTQRSGDYCRLCNKGPFGDKKQRDAHILSPRHQRMQTFDQAWHNYLTTVSKKEKS